jgi:hypothetical protein
MCWLGMPDGVFLNQIHAPDTNRRQRGAEARTRAAFPYRDRIDVPHRAARFLFGCDLYHRAMCNSILGCRHVPDSGGEDVRSFGRSGTANFCGMAQECVRWLPSRIGPRVVADPGSVRLWIAICSWCFSSSWAHLVTRAPAIALARVTCCSGVITTSLG